MNSRAIPAVQSLEPTRPSGVWRLFPLVLLAAAALLTGCTSVKQYSLESWQGPLPMEDLRYVTVDK